MFQEAVHALQQAAGRVRLQGLCSKGRVLRGERKGLGLWV
jgi:hypothetical protein